jgi:hypothetical protein
MFSDSNPFQLVPAFIGDGHDLIRPQELEVGLAGVQFTLSVKEDKTANGKLNIVASSSIQLFVITGISLKSFSYSISVGFQISHRVQIMGQVT